MGKNHQEFLPDFLGMHIIYIGCRAPVVLWAWLDSLVWTQQLSTDYCLIPFPRKNPTTPLDKHERVLVWPDKHE
jgi:hypothetical protein